MRSIVPIIILSILLTGCGFKPIYSSKNSNFHVIEITNLNKNKNSFAIEQAVMSLSNQESMQKIKLEFDYNEIIDTILKDSRGDPSKKKLSITINLIVKDVKDIILNSKIFNEEFSYDVQSDKFSMTQYENNIIENLSNKISNDIVFLLNTLE
tara:strand:+ start:757 stop:1215 length:459 start_codon:yes stop_codon:yes gene_type:complete